MEEKDRASALILLSVGLSLHPRSTAHSGTRTSWNGASESLRSIGSNVSSFSPLIPDQSTSGINIRLATLSFDGYRASILIRDGTPRGCLTAVVIEADHMAELRVHGVA